MALSQNPACLKTVLQYLDGFLVSKALFTACDMGIFDILETQSTMSSEDIARQLSSSARGLEVLLNACEAMKLLCSEEHSGKVLYRNTEASSTYLTKSSSKSLIPWIEFFSDVAYPGCQYLEDAVREGKNQNARIFGPSQQEYFGAMYRSKEKALQYITFLSSMWNISGEDVVTAFDLSPFADICDLGGSTGALSKHYILKYPESRITVYDLPEVVQLIKENSLDPSDERISFHEGDFFKDPIPEADLYIVARVIHLLPDEKCIELLRKIYAACKPGGGILLVHTLLNEDNRELVPAHLYNFFMLVFTDGRDRKPSEITSLLKAAGFRDIKVKVNRILYDAVLGRK